MPITFGGVALYRAWTEILPEPENPLSLTVNPGDKITTTVKEIKPGVWKMIVADETTKKAASRKVSYSGSTHASVESIHERPCVVAPCNVVEDFREYRQHHERDVRSRQVRHGRGGSAENASDDSCRTVPPSTSSCSTTPVTKSSRPRRRPTSTKTDPMGSAWPTAPSHLRRRKADTARAWPARR